jgi:phage gp36-like protein
MAYSTVEDVRQLVLSGRRSENRDENANELEDDQIEYAIASADAQITGVIRKRYVMPLVEPIPSLVHNLSIEIASYLCELIFRGSTPLSDESTVVRRYDRARRMLDDIKFGRLEVDAVELSDANDALASVYNPYDGTLFPPSHIFGMRGAGGEYAELDASNGIVVPGIPADRSHY